MSAELRRLRRYRARCGRDPHQLDARVRDRLCVRYGPLPVSLARASGSYGHSLRGAHYFPDSQ